MAGLCHSILEGMAGVAKNSNAVFKGFGQGFFFC